MTGRVPNVWAAIIIPVPASALALILRIKARRMTKMGVGYDDALSIAAWFVALGYAILLIVWTTCYYMGRKIGHFPEDKIDHILEKSHEILFTSEILYSWSIFLSKMSVLTFYRRIFQFSSIRVPIIILMKIAVIGIFSLGSLVGIASIFQIVEAQKYTSNSREFPYDFSLAMVWANVEVHLAVFTSCLALLRPIFRKFIPGLSSGNTTYPANGLSHASNTYTNSIALRRSRSPRDVEEVIEGQRAYAYLDYDAISLPGVKDVNSISRLQEREHHAPSMTESGGRGSLSSQNSVR
ncbi:hypothetical protein H9Q69_008710 [Fusarium xylarioides]|uniref:Rhodopsin domain-containing protein n=1 Tax=Fusarium xylarioides TaxID=221167 RepID=A0A9P7HN10_9HYPO|nr:hypothetical protein H9Q72_011384 [Fusarium xylarioides]KAG5792246.1 hypothetical protein H9Q69_008710 [Fusarium xylarioides]